MNKADLLAGAVDADVIAVSARSGKGIPELVAVLGDRAAAALTPGARAAMTRTRHREALRDCVGLLERGRQAGAVELKAEELRLAVRALGRITGRVDVEDVLDAIFRDFCIGK